MQKQRRMPISRFAILALMFVFLALFVRHYLTFAFADNRDVLPPPVDWVSEVAREHPLVGKIWSRQKGGLVSAQELGMAMAKARFVLLGEVHDNADHHLWQAWGIRNISKLRGARIVEGAPQIDIVAMEMLKADQIPALDKFYGRDKEVPRPRGPKAFRRMTKWDKSGWPDFAIYQPIVEAALSEQIVIVPASPTWEENKAVSRKGLASLEDADALALMKPFPEGEADALKKEIEAGHCGLMPKASIQPMTIVQRFRDAIMADALLNVSSGKGGILVAGNGHVRRDRAVPWYLIARGVKPENIVSVIHREVSADANDVKSYLPRDSDGTPAADFIVFTPAHKREDMCEKMRAHMQKKAAGHNKDKKSKAGEEEAVSK